MGNWYTNISVKGARPTDVLSQLNELGRSAIVAPSTGDWLIVYDQECDKFDLDALESLALTLSTRLQCTAIPCMNADDDLLWFAIYENGQRTSRYASLLEEFEDRTEFPATQTFASAICRVFGREDRTRQVRSILSRGRGLLGLLTLVKIRLAYVVEIERHRDLAQLLAMPTPSVGLGYTYVDRGEHAPGMQPDALLRTNDRGFH